MKYIGIDYGTKKIGVAVSDDTGTLAFPLVTVSAGPTALQTIATLITDNGVGKIVLGESRNFKNEPNAVMEDIQQFEKDIAELSGLPVAYEREFFTSTEAARQFAPNTDKQSSRKEPPSQEKLDASAAAIILQSYLDKQK